MDKSWEKHQAFLTGGEESWLRGLARLAWVVPRKTRFRRRDGNPVSANRLVLETDTEQRSYPHVCGDGAVMCPLQMSQRLDPKDLGHKGVWSKGLSHD